MAQILVQDHTLLLAPVLHNTSQDVPSYPCHMCLSVMLWCPGDLKFQ